MRNENPQKENSRYHISKQKSPTPIPKFLILLSLSPSQLLKSQLLKTIPPPPPLSTFSSMKKQHSNDPANSLDFHKYSAGEKKL